MGAVRAARVADAVCRVCSVCSVCGGCGVCKVRSVCSGCSVCRLCSVLLGGEPQAERLLSLNLSEWVTLFRVGVATEEGPWTEAEFALPPPAGRHV